VTAPTHITVRVPLKIRSRPGRKAVVTVVVDELPTQTTTRADPTLLKALARAFRYQRMLDIGKYTTIGEMATAEKLDRGYLGRLLQLTLLAPDIVEAIVEGGPAEGVTLPAMMGPLHAEWEEQRITLGDWSSFPPSTSTTHKAPDRQRCTDMARNASDSREASILPIAR
jgi:hypothetical protein